MRPLDEKKIFFDGDVFEYKVEFNAENYELLMSKNLSFDQMKGLTANDKEAMMILRHPDVYNSTGEQSHNYSSSAKRWIVELSHKKVSQEYMGVVTKMLAMNRFFQEDPVQWREIAFVFGVNPVGKNADELASMLAAPDRGILISTVEKAVDFIEFIKDFETSSPRVVVQKALALGVIYKERESYSYYDTPLGRTIDDVIAYVGRDKTVNMQVLRSIEEYDVDLERYKGTCSDAKELLVKTLAESKGEKVRTKKKEPAQVSTEAQ